MSEKPRDSRKEERRSWGRSIEFMLSQVGYAVGLTNVLRFPYICMKNGGGAFLIPYFMAVLLCGVPLLFLEMVMGQYARSSCIACWNVYSPVCKGIGYGAFLLSAVATFYYQINYAWIIYYIYQSFSWELPWKTCNATWNTPACVSGLDYDVNRTGSTVRFEAYAVNSSDNATKAVSAAEEFYHRNVLGKTDGIEDLGGIQVHLVITHIIACVALFFCLIKGVKSVGKVLYVTATVPYVFIIVFIIRSALLPGSLDGVLFYIRPDFSRLMDSQIWLQAFIQICFSFGIGWGGCITMASYNKFHHPVHREAIAVPLISALTSLLCGFLVFSVIGFLAHQTGRTIEEAVSSGPGLAFVAYPEAAAHLPGAPIWAVLFFVMLILAGCDSHFVCVETCISSLNDAMNIRKKHQVWVTVGFILVCLLVGILFTTGGAVYIFQIIDWYFSLCVFLFSLIQCIGLVWLYGHKRLFENIEAMIGIKLPKIFFILLWGVVYPILLLISLVMSLVRLSAPTYGSYIYPDWVPVFGACLPCAIALPVPILAVYTFWRADASSVGERLRVTLFGGRDDEEKSEEEDCFV